MRPSLTHLNDSRAWQRANKSKFSINVCWTDGELALFALDPMFNNKNWKQILLLNLSLFAETWMCS